MKTVAINESDEKTGYLWEEITLSLKPDAKISELKKQIEEKMGISCAKQKLFVHIEMEIKKGGESYKRERNIQLDAKKTLRNYNLGKDAMVYCVEEELFMEKTEESKENEEYSEHKSGEEDPIPGVEPMNRAEQASVESTRTLERLEETKSKIVSEERELEERIGETQNEVEKIEEKVEETKKEGETAIKELEIVLNKLRALRKENEKE